MNSPRDVRARRAAPFASLAPLALALLVVVSPRSVRANGRYPLADQLVIDPANPMHLVARSTFGLLDSDDGGKTWHWICEKAIGYFGAEDPPIAVTANGSTVVAHSKGLSTSADGGCAWVRNGGITGTWFGVDATVHPSRPHEVLAIASKYLDATYSVSLLRSTDDGATWSEISSLGQSFLATTLEVAPSNPDRVYVSGKILPNGSAAVWRSDDGGLTFQEFPLLDLTGSFSMYIGGVDPQNPDVVYVRTVIDDHGRALVSHDGGETFRTVWEAPDDIAGFALSPDGSWLAVGGSSVGVSVASTSDFQFRKTSNAGVYCLTWWGDKLLVCTKEAIDGFSIGVSGDQGEHFSSLLHLPDVSPRSCGSTTSAAVCAGEWEAIATVIGADGGTPGATPQDAGADIANVPSPTPTGCACDLSARRHNDARFRADSFSVSLFGLAIALAVARRTKQI